MIFETYFIYPAPRFPQGDWDPDDFECEDVHFASTDGVALHGWLLEHPRPVAHAVYFHGNGENVALAAPYVSALRDRFALSILLFDYRGYGRSEGRPHEAGLIADGLAAQAWMAQRYQVPAEGLLLIGRSLGGAIAVATAAERGARGLVVFSSFHSMVDLAGWHFPYLPLKMFLRNRYDSAARIRATRCPLLQSHSEQDEIVPYAMGRRLFEAAPQTQKEFFGFRGLRHNEGEPVEYLDVFDRFLSELGPLPRSARTVSGGSA